MAWVPLTHLCFNASTPGVIGATGTFFCLLRTEQNWRGESSSSSSQADRVESHGILYISLGIRLHIHANLKFQRTHGKGPLFFLTVCPTPRLPDPLPGLSLSQSSSLLTAPGSVCASAAQQGSSWETRCQIALLVGICSPYK